MLSGFLLIGTGMVAFTVVIHTLGVIGLIAWLKNLDYQSTTSRTYLRLTLILILVILGIMLMHTIEIWAWAFLYIRLDQFDDWERALYFSTVTFTTLGYGDIVLEERWRILSAVEAANGIVLFGVSTAIVFAVMRKLFEAASIVRPEN